jgi:hypothetical protein
MEGYMATEKVCIGCQVSKPTSEFFKACKSKDGLNWKCKDCYAIRKKELAELKAHPPLANTKMCRSCKETKPFTDFFAEKNGVHGLKGKCKLCCLATKHEYREKKREERVIVDKPPPVKKEQPATPPPIVKKGRKKKALSQMPSSAAVIKLSEEDKAKLNYDRINQVITSKGCTLLTTVEQIQSLKMHSKSYYRIIAACGHENIVLYDMFKAQGCGVLCRPCRLDSVASKNKKINANGICNDVEYQGFCYLRDQLRNTFIVEKMVEGTLADFAIKPVTIEADEWLPIQLKVTTKPSKYSNNYSFKIKNKSYPNMVVILMCVEDKRVWMFNGNELPKETVSIGSKRSKYSKFEVSDMHHALVSFYDTLPRLSIDTTNIPLNICQQREQAYRRKREGYLPYIEFDYPECESLVYDFTVNGMRIQEKVASKTKTRCTGDNIAYTVIISRGGKADGSNKRNGFLYAQSDNDYYWINIPDTTKFFLFPEEILLQHNKISPRGVVTRKSCSLGLYTYDRPQSPNNWIHDHMFDYTTVTEDQMKKFFQK